MGGVRVAAYSAVVPLSFLGSNEAKVYETSLDDWIRRMPEESGFSQEEFETHVREE